jgi:hypothetical protein
MSFKQFIGGDASLLRGKWPLVFSILAVASLVWYFFGLKDEYPRAGSWTGMAFGIIALSLMVFLISYKIRKHVYTIKLGTTNSWLSAHIYLGVLAAMIALMHSGLSPASGFNTFLLVVFLLVIASGVVGGLIFKLNPVVIAKGGREVVQKSHMADEIKKRAQESDNEVAGMSETCRTIYKNYVKPLVASEKIRWRYLFSTEREMIGRRKVHFEKLKDHVPNEEKYQFSTVCDQLLENERIAFKLVKYEVMDAWLAFHMPLSGVALTAVIFHVFTVFYY